MAPSEPSPAVPSRPQWPWLVALGVVLVGMMALALPDHIAAGDAGEFATIMLRGGVPHPSGYPWMRMLGAIARALEDLGLTPTRAAAWPCAMAGVGAWLVLWTRLARWAQRPLATFVVLLLATASPMVVHVADSEVWGLHLLACAVIVVVATHPRRRPWQLGLVFGLAVSHHLSAVLMLPLVVGAAWPRPWSASALARAAAAGVGTGLLGLLPYATLAIGSGGAWRWGDTRSVGGLLAHVTRADYGVFALSLHKENPALLDQWQRALGTVGSALSGGASSHVAVACLLLLAIIVLAWRRPEAIDAPVWYGLWGTLATTTLLFPAAHNIDPTHVFGAWILERFDLLPILLWSIPMTIALRRVLARIEHRAVLGLLGLTAVVLLVVQPLRTLARGLPSDDDGIERYAKAVLATPQPGRFAIVIGTDDHRIFPLLYVQHVLGLGGDVLYIDASLLSQAWYRAHLRQRWPALPDVEKPVALIGTLWRDPALADTPIYLSNVFSRPSATLPLVPEGVLLRVLAPDQLDTDPRTFVERHIAAMRRYGPVPPHTPRAAAPWTEDLYAAYNDGTGRLLTALHAEGREAEARMLLDALAADGTADSPP